MTNLEMIQKLDADKLADLFLNFDEGELELEMCKKCTRYSDCICTTETPCTYETKQMFIDWLNGECKNAL